MWAWTAGGAISTVDDMKTYVEALVDGGLLDPATQKIRLDSLTPPPGSPAGAAQYGLGIARFGPLIGHDGQIPGNEQAAALPAGHELELLAHQLRVARAGDGEDHRDGPGDAPAGEGARPAGPGQHRRQPRHAGHSAAGAARLQLRTTAGPAEPGQHPVLRGIHGLRIPPGTWPRAPFRPPTWTTWPRPPRRSIPASCGRRSPTRS